MSDYSKSYDGAAKDAAVATIIGTDFDTEFSAIETAIGTKANKTTPSTAGNVATLSAAGDLQDSGLQVSNATYSNASDGGSYINSTDLIVSNYIPTTATWESIGPTGSGMTNIWTALDSLPTDVDWIKVRIRTIFQNTTGSIATGDMAIHEIYARKYGSSLTAGLGNDSCVVSSSSVGDAAAKANYASVVEVTIPVSTLRFDMARYSADVTTSQVNMFLIGYGYNAY